MVLFGVSWGETFVLIGAAAVFIGRKDLPSVSRIVGVQVGRIVGLLQGARARATKFAETDKEMQLLQRDLRSSLRELDMARAELSVVTSMDRGLSTTSSNFRRQQLLGGGGGMGVPSALQPTSLTRTTPATPTATTPLLSSTNNNNNMDTINTIDKTLPTSNNNNTHQSSLSLSSSKSQSIAAVAEEEWVRQGIGFQSRAEAGTGSWSNHNNNNIATNNNTNNTTNEPMAMVGGAVILSNMLRQSLIYDQYDRITQEQEEVLKQKHETKKKRKEKKEG